jgi:hypothetical protein
VSDRAVEKLKVTSPRLEQDEFKLTPCAMPDRPDARYLDDYYTKTRAVYEPETEDGTEQVELNGLGGDSA